MDVTSLLLPIVPYVKQASEENKKKIQKTAIIGAGAGVVGAIGGVMIAGAAGKSKFVFGIIGYLLAGMAGTIVAASIIMSDKKQ